MTETCALRATGRAVNEGRRLEVACLGGSLTVGSSPRYAPSKPWRSHFMDYLTDLAAQRGCEAVPVRCAIGAMKSYGGVLLMDRLILPYSPALVCVEFSVNDKASPDKDLVRKSVEGIIRKLRSHPSRPDILFLGAGCRPGKGNNDQGLVDHTIHRELCEHYGVPFLDIQDYLLTTLADRGQTWDDVHCDASDDLHLNDYGNEMWFEGMRDWFGSQRAMDDGGGDVSMAGSLPAPLHGVEFEQTRVLVPSPETEGLELSGRWEAGGSDLGISWYMEGVLAGRPGDRLVYRFEGTAVATICHAYENGLKVEARLDGKEVVGPYTNFRDVFGNVDIIAHGIPFGTHELELVVCPPSRRNKQPDPTARIAFIATAGVDGGDSPR